MVHVHQSLAAYNLLHVLQAVDGLALFCMVSGLVANGLVQFLQYLLCAVLASAQVRCEYK